MGPNQHLGVHPTRPDGLKWLIWPPCMATVADRVQVNLHLPVPTGQVKMLGKPEPEDLQTISANLRTTTNLFMLHLSQGDNWLASN